MKLNFTLLFICILPTSVAYSQMPYVYTGIDNITIIYGFSNDYRRNAISARESYDLRYKYRLIHDTNMKIVRSPHPNNDINEINYWKILLIHEDCNDAVRTFLLYKLGLGQELF